MRVTTMPIQSFHIFTRGTMSPATKWLVVTTQAILLGYMNILLLHIFTRGPISPATKWPVVTTYAMLLGYINILLLHMEIQVRG